MIRTRLSVAFALITALALAQCAFAWWAASTAAHYAERSVVAAGLLAEYESVGANKQRLKVWFAEGMLAANAPAALRDTLLQRMNFSISELRALAARDAALRGTVSPETAVIEALDLNLKIFGTAVREALPRIANPGDQALRWRGVINAFDELSGRDMREVLRDAVARQKLAARAEYMLLAAALERQRWANALLAALVALMGALAVWYFIVKLQRPFARLTTVAGHFANGDLTARSGLNGRDEFGRLGSLLDSMAASLAAAQRRDTELKDSLDALVATRTRAVTQAHESMMRAEARRRQFFAEVSHELRTPVTVIRGEADIALRNQDADPAPLREALARIVAAAVDLGARVQDLLDAARSGSPDYAFTLQQLKLASVMRAASSQMQAVARYRNITLLCGEDTVPSAVVHADRERLQQALTVVLDNALRYSPVGSTVELSLEREVDWVGIVVEDQGPAMSEDEIERAFEPHFRGAAAQRSDAPGAGLGLTIAQRILLAHGGSVEIRCGARGGLRVSLLLPECVDGVAARIDERLVATS